MTKNVEQESSGGGAGGAGIGHRLLPTTEERILEQLVQMNANLKQIAMAIHVANGGATGGGGGGGYPEDIPGRANLPGNGVVGGEISIRRIP